MLTYHLKITLKKKRKRYSVVWLSVHFNHQVTIRMYNIAPATIAPLIIANGRHNPNPNPNLNPYPTLNQNPIITLTLTLSCWRYHRRSNCRRSKCRSPTNHTCTMCSYKKLHVMCAYTVTKSWHEIAINKKFPKLHLLTHWDLLWVVCSTETVNTWQYFNKGIHSSEILVDIYTFCMLLCIHMHLPGIDIIHTNFQQNKNIASLLFSKALFHER